MKWTLYIVTRKVIYSKVLNTLTTLWRWIKIGVFSLHDMKSTFHCFSMSQVDVVCIDVKARVSTSSRDPSEYWGNVAQVLGVHNSTEPRSCLGARGEGGEGGGVVDRGWNLPGSDASADTAASMWGMRFMILPDVMSRPKPSWCANA